MNRFVTPMDLAIQSSRYIFKTLKGGDRILEVQGNQLETLTARFNDYLSINKIESNDQFKLYFDSSENVTRIQQKNSKSNDPTLSDFRYWMPPTKLDDLINNLDSSNTVGLITQFHELFINNELMDFQKIKVGKCLINKLYEAGAMQKVPEILEGVIKQYITNNPNIPVTYPLITSTSYRILEPSSNRIRDFFENIVPFDYLDKNSSNFRELIKQK
ncbi:MAG: hypothetical protein WC758_03650 [Candidatus Woesearchaeota archaeon]|jgi:hypothetical protein